MTYTPWLLTLICLGSPTSFAQTKGPPTGGGFAALTAGLGLAPSPIATLGYGGQVTPGADARGTTVQHRVTASVPVSIGAQNSYGVSALASSLEFGRAATLRGGAPIASYYRRQEISGQYARRLREERNLSVRLTVGSASDRPFASDREMTFGAIAAYAYPANDHRQWILTVFMSNNNSIANFVPVPGFIYLYRTPRFLGMFGLPFATVRWQPGGQWVTSFSLVGPSVTAELAYGPPVGVQAFTGFAWGQQSFLRADRIRTRDRLFFDEKRATLGVRSTHPSGLSGDVQAGFAFDRSLYEGRGFGRRERGSARIGDAWLLGLNLRYGF